MRKLYTVKLTPPAGKVSYLVADNRFSWTKARAVFLAGCSSVLTQFKGYAIEVEVE